MNIQSLEIQSTKKWDGLFFERFNDYRNSMYKDEKYFLKEDLTDLNNQLINSHFEKNSVDFEAFLLLNNKGIVGRVICFFEPINPNICFFGFFEISEDPIIHRKMIEIIEKYSREKGAKAIKGPINGNFFFSYRIKLEGDTPFYGEPYYKNFYPSLFESWGFKAEKKWRSWKMDIFKSFLNFKKVRRHTTKSNKKNKKMVLKFVFPWRWEKYMEDIYKMFMNSYKEMSEFSPIDYETFTLLYRDFKFLLNPFFSYMVELDGKPVGFCVNFFDPLKILIGYQRMSEKRIFQYKITKVLLKIYLIMRQMFNLKRILLMYVGKIPAEDGTELKGIQSFVFKFLGIFLLLSGLPETFVCYTSDDSPALNSFRKDALQEIAVYGVFYKRI